MKSHMPRTSDKKESHAQERDRLKKEIINLTREVEDLRSELLNVNGGRKELEEQKVMSTAMAEHSPNMIFINVKGRIVYANRLCEEIIGYSREELYQPTFNFLDLTAPAYRDLVKENFHRHMAGKEIEPYEYALITRDGKIIYTVLSTKLITYGGDPAILGIITDISARKAMEEDIQRINEDLRQLNAAKDKFFSIIAHDLRSPFSGLLGLSEVISDPTQELTLDEMRKYAGRLHILLRNQFNLLQNLLEWSRLQRGGINYKSERLNLRSFVENVLDQLSINIIRKNVELDNLVDSQIVILADAEMLQSILLNLLSNAIKFTDSGGKINIRAARSEQWIETVIEDTGVGIRKERLAKIFELDKVNSTAGTAGEKGTGLGLILCKEFIEKHGGVIHAESGPGKGSKFIFTLPAE